MNKKVIKRAIIISWIILILCLAIKIFGGSLFNVAFSNERIIRFDAFLDRTLWAQAILFSITAYIGFNLYYLAICEKRNFDKFLHITLIPYFVIVSIFKVWLHSIDAFGWTLLFDIMSGLIIPLLFLGKPKKRYLRVVVAFGLYILFSLISLGAKSIPLGSVIIKSTFAEIVLSFDLYIMLFLFYLYVLRNVKERKTNESYDAMVRECARCERVRDNA